MHVLTFRFFRLARGCVVVPLLCLWMAGIVGCDPGLLDLFRGPPAGGPGGSCSDFFLDIVSTPSGVMAWNWGGDTAGRNWGTTDGTWLDVVWSGHTIRTDTRGLAFEMSAGDGLNSNVFMLEYTLPRTICPASLAWDAPVSMELPNGVCICESGLGCPADCSGSATARAVFQLVVIEDPTGQMSVSGSGRPLLETSILQALETMPPGDVIGFNGTDRNATRKGWRLRGDFDVLGGVEPRLFIGIAAQMGLAGDGIVCTAHCNTSPNDTLLEEAILLIESGGGIGVAMTRIE